MGDVAMGLLAGVALTAAAFVVAALAIWADERGRHR